MPWLRKWHGRWCAREERSGSPPCGYRRNWPSRCRAWSRFGSAEPLPAARFTRWVGLDGATLGCVADDALSGRERTLRRWIIALAALAGVLVILVLAVVLYWLRFVLPTEPDPFTRGPWVAEVSGTTARIAWRIEPEQPVDVSVATPGGRTIKGNWTAPL